MFEQYTENPLLTKELDNIKEYIGTDIFNAFIKNNCFESVVLNEINEFTDIENIRLVVNMTSEYITELQYKVYGRNIIDEVLPLLEKNINKKDSLNYIVEGIGFLSDNEKKFIIYLHILRFSFTFALIGLLGVINHNMFGIHPNIFTHSIHQFDRYKNEIIYRWNLNLIK